MESFRYALINNSIVTNVIMADDNFVELIRPQNQHVVKCRDEVGIGWGYEDGVFVPPPLPPTATEEPPTL